MVRDASASTRYDNPDGVAGLAVMVGLLTWIIVGLLLAYRRGFDPEARYAGLLPRESIAALEGRRISSRPRARISAR
jgi:hypothetical protein